jgi:kinesin family protein C2/C3
VRVRPALEWERQRDAASARQYGGCPESVVDALSSHEVAAWDRPRKGWRAFAYDSVFGPNASQADVFQCAAPLAEAVLNGFNAACLAYGGTGSGKSHTMLGGIEPEGAGLAPRLVRRVFELARARGLGAPNGRGASGTLRVRVSVLEIYNDEIRDLLVDPAEPRLKLEVRTPMSGAADGISASAPTVISGLSSLDVEGAEEVEDILARALLARATAATRMHENSSRSHAILRMDVAVTAAMDAVDAAWDWGAPSGTVARLHLADLAGSERISKSGVSGERLRETGHINSSLACLGDVMEALDKKATHVPFRNSKLTHVLSDCLGASAKTLLIATVGTGAFTAEEAGQTLAFAARARKIDVGAAERQLHYKAAVLAARSSEERTATAELTADAAESAQVALETAMARREAASAAKIASLEATLSGLQAEVVSLRTRLDVEGGELLLAREEAVASSLLRYAGEDAGRMEIVAEAARNGTQELRLQLHWRPSMARARAHWSVVRSALYDVVLASQAGYDFWEGRLRD